MWWVSKDFEGDSHGLFENAILAFAWKVWGKAQIPQLGYLLKQARFKPIMY
jgi:hypothetical protein